MSTIKTYFKLLRLEQYSKNLFIFAPLFFGLKFFYVSYIIEAFLYFILFSFVASAIYIFNDFKDIEEDKKHPEKKNRPLASGIVSKNSAIFVMFFCLFIGLFGIYFVNKNVFFMFVLYILINFLYSVFFKHVAIVDVFFIAIGFLIRIFIGGIGLNILISHWLIILTFFLAIFLGFAKRRYDVYLYIEKGLKTRKLLDGYNVEFLNSSMIISAIVIIISYLMYTVSPDVIAKTHTDKLYITVFFVFLGIMRYLQISFVEMSSGDPTYIFLKDKFIKIVLFIWVLIFGYFLYFHNWVLLK